MSYAGQVIYLNHDASERVERSARFLDKERGVKGRQIRSLIEGLYNAQSICHGLAVKSGWWNDIQTGQSIDRNVGEMLALIHSEISEAFEAHRKDLSDDHLPHRKGIECELADTLIRIFDLAGRHDLDLSGAVVEKLAYNQRRADHQVENRRLEGGKKC